MTGTTGKHTIPQTTSHALARMHIRFRFLSRVDDLAMVRRCLNGPPVDTVIAAGQQFLTGNDFRLIKTNAGVTLLQLLQ